MLLTRILESAVYGFPAASVSASVLRERFTTALAVDFERSNKR
jgi:hypothetical protein